MYPVSLLITVNQLVDTSKYKSNQHPSEKASRKGLTSSHTHTLVSFLNMLGLWLREPYIPVPPLAPKARTLLSGRDVFLGEVVYSLEGEVGRSEMFTECFSVYLLWQHCSALALWLSP